MKDNDIQQQIDILEKRVADLEKAIRSPSQNSFSGQQKKEQSLREFLITKKASDDVKKTLAIGYYFEKFEGFSSFNSDDLRAGYEKAKEKKPININDKVNMSIKNGHMAEATAKKDNKKAWYVTNTGESFVGNDFNLSKK